ncbi:Spherulation-specific family 4 [Tricladium varicosporioides]|nr:Spherulation-specific family 4 [Hymenoscyphus varicosporioides]
MVSSPFILLPLYISPALNAWMDVYSNITANPNLTFRIIINPNNGPGPPNAYPDSDYIAGIARLNSYPNTQLHGYVHTSYATRPIADVETDIRAYRNWAQYDNVDIHMSGIFFDEAPSDYKPENYNYMSSITNYAQSTMGASASHVIFNPGAVADSRYHALADVIVAFENYWDEYTDDLFSWIGGAYVKQSAFIVYDFPGTVSQQGDFVKKMIANGLGGLFVTTRSVLSEVSEDWKQFCASM